MTEMRSNQGRDDALKLASPFNQRLRRLRMDPTETVGHIAADLGPRMPTSLGEAKAAAYFNGRLRLAGLSVSADVFNTAGSAGWDGVLIAGLALLAVLLYGWLPGVALALALVTAGMALYRMLMPHTPVLVRPGTSQNIVGTRASGLSPRRRVVLLAPLDSPPALGVLRIVAVGARRHSGRLVATAVLILLMGAGLWDTQPVWWYLQAAPVLYLILLAAVDVVSRYRPATPGATCHAGALAALLAAVDQLGDTEGVELWLVGLGATTSSAGGIDDMLRRYPFEAASTLMIGVEGIGSGNLAYVTREGLLLQSASDPLLLRLAAAADASDPRINAEPRAYRASPTIAGELRRRGWRTLTVTCLDDGGQPPYYANRDDIADVADAEILDRAAQLIAELVRQISRMENEELRIEK